VRFELGSRINGALGIKPRITLDVCRGDISFSRFSSASLAGWSPLVVRKMCYVLTAIGGSYIYIFNPRVAAASGPNLGRLGGQDAG
jgi:hypothetical protein